MSTKRSTNHFQVSQILQIIGRPGYILFTLCLLIIVSYLHLLTIFFQNLKKLTFPRLPRFKLPKIHLFKPSLPRIKPLFLLLSLSLGLAAYAFYFFILSDLPSVDLLSSNTPALSTKILDRNGNLLYQIYKDENRSLIKLADLPPYLIQATIAAEDKNFYHHHGVDPVGVFRAAVNNLTCYRLHQTCTSLQGGSTITQQLIKNTLLSPEQTIKRKLKELVLALETERRYPKDTILEMYLNQVPYGGTAYGVEEASWQYLGKSARDLTLAEAAFIAGLPVSPTALSPFGTTPYLAKIRQQQVLERMVAEGMISESDKVTATAEPIHLSSQSTTISAPHFVMYVRDLLVKEFGDAIVSRGGLTVTTTLDSSIQATLQEQINQELSRLNNLHVTNGAGLVIEPSTGEILAMVGSRNFFDTDHDGQVNLTITPRQPGSSIKPITYALAFLHGLSPSSIIEDVPTCYHQPGSADYCPKNYDGRFHGSVTLKTALASSYNIPATKLLNSLGVENLVELARTMGITTWDDSSRFGLSLTLGSGEVKMIDLAQVYSTFATNGTQVPFKPILSVKDKSGVIIPTDFDNQIKKQIIPESVAFQINSILADNNARSPAFGTNSVLRIPSHTVAVKTGTTNNLRDNWTFGYTPNILVATWVGNNDNTPMSSVASGITGASPIWSRTIQKLLANSPDEPFTQPSTIVKAKSGCNNSYDYFLVGTEPHLNCSSENPGQIL